MNVEVSASELFGIAGTFPRPGWVLLDAIRDHRFTGEVMVESQPPVRVYSDRGYIYLAERVTDPSIGSRLVDAGALTAIQLERGAIRVGDNEHLGRLFERVPTVDRHTVLVTAELMTDECVGWLANQNVSGARSTPYRHHESGIHQWTRPPGWVDLRPGDPLPAPSVDEAPVDTGPPGPQAPAALVDHPLGEPFDDVIEWDEPSWLDTAGFDIAPIPTASSRTEPPVADAHDAHDGQQPSPDDARPSGDWVDRLESDGLPEPGTDLLGSPARLPKLPIEPLDRFELIWPSGEIDEEFGVFDEVEGDDHDRIGTTARLGVRAQEREHDTGADAPVDDEVDHGAKPVVDEAEPTDEIVLAVRRAVASIEVGSLAARQRLVDATDASARGIAEAIMPLAPATEAAEAVPAPGRVAVRSGRTDWSRRTVTRSVFDEPAAVPEEPEEAEVPAAVEDHRDRRAGALRRLISSLRR